MTPVPVGVLFPVDMHLHSAHSPDGELFPEAIVELAKKAGMRHIALTDHNCVNGVAAAVEAGKAHGVQVIPGVELDCLFEGLNLHVLGYNIDYADAAYRTVWTGVTEKERAASATRVELVRGLGIAVDGDELSRMASDGVVTPECIAEIALADPANDDNTLLSPFRPGGPRSDNPFVNFYWDLCSPGKPAHIPIDFITLAEAIRLIDRTGGIPVLAHPGQTLRDHPAALPAIVKAGIRGLEAYSSYHTPEACRFWESEARKHSLPVTCGSDFHGKTKPAIRIGGHGRTFPSGADAADRDAAIEQFRLSLLLK